MAEENANSALIMDRGIPLGNSEDIDGRRALHVKIKNETAVISNSFSRRVKAEVTFTDITIDSVLTYNNLYSYSGSGFLIGFNIEFSGTNIIPRLVIDGETVFDGVSIASLNSLLVTLNSIDRRQAGHGLVTVSSDLDWSLKYPIRFNSSVLISAKLSSVGAQKLNQAVYYIQKDT